MNKSLALAAIVAAVALAACGKKEEAPTIVVVPAPAPAVVVVPAPAPAVVAPATDASAPMQAASDAKK